MINSIKRFFYLRFHSKELKTLATLRHGRPNYTSFEWWEGLPDIVVLNTYRIYQNRKDRQGHPCSDPTTYYARLVLYGLFICDFKCFKPKKRRLEKILQEELLLYEFAQSYGHISYN